MAVVKEETNINGIPAIIWGSPSHKVYLYIHGQGGNKEEAHNIAGIVCGHGYQILSIDLPGHGSREREIDFFDPWHIVPELTGIMEAAKKRWESISLFASSIGAWFSMLSFCDERLESCLFVSPVLDMKRLMLKMMGWANVSEQQLKEELMIPTAFGQTLSWEYWEYVLSHPIARWRAPTKILYGEEDHLIDRDVVEYFSQKFHCKLEIMENGQHWFHTKEQINVLQWWVNKNIF
ncbi:MAG: alpha/beta hydrolase [Lachnospiraceae bacterium]|nr:alpha/beta hydrolase [Lachnospiraceae bacterium]